MIMSYVRLVFSLKPGFKSVFSLIIQHSNYFCLLPFYFLLACDGRLLLFEVSRLRRKCFSFRLSFRYPAPPRVARGRGRVRNLMNRFKQGCYDLPARPLLAVLPKAVSCFPLNSFLLLYTLFPVSFHKLSTKPEGGVL